MPRTLPLLVTLVLAAPAATPALAQPPNHTEITALFFLPDGKRPASGGLCTATIPGFVQGSVQSDHVRLWDPETGKEVRQHPLRGSTVAFSPDGRGFVAAGHYATGKQREGGGVSLQGGTLASFGRADKDAAWFALQGLGSAAAFSADGRLLALAYGNRL